ncbi:MAG: hypothetical protein HYH09_08240, partial [Acinetobacter baumannii]|nr:hypothetical protein [Acinetobacter baumannii]
MDGVDYPAVNNGDGTWTLADNTLPVLADGPHTITVTATDAAGNVGNDTGVVTVDTTAPPAPVVNPIEAGSTDPITGTGEPGATVTVTYPDGTTATTTVGSDGTWSVPNPGNLTDGQTVTATQTDPAGNTSPVGTGAVEDTIAPVVTVDALVTNDSTPELTGTIDDPTATVVVTINGVDYPAINNGDGTWTLANDAVAALAEGDTPVTVTATDPAGNEGTGSGTVTVTPVNDAPTITVTATNDFTEDSGAAVGDIVASYTTFDEDG